MLKYDRIDPAEVQQLKDEIERLQAEKAGAEGASAEQVTALNQRVRGVIRYT
jgi:hypothetical protein